jgi:glucosyl-3-phosphoglycerate synthase
VINIALLVPAFNEANGMPRTAAAMREACDAGLVSSATVLDGGSSDDTSDIARQLGVSTLFVPHLFPELGPVLGKGDSLFRGVQSINADWYVFLDADLGNITIDHIAALVSPISQQGVKFVKGGFVRVDEHGVPRDIPAGRVSELVGRPLLRRAAPQLTYLSQPLSGQVAIEGDLARSLSFVTGYGIEIAMLIDVFRACGEGAIVEADMGSINNRFKPDDALEDVRDQVLAGAALRIVTMPDYGLVMHGQVTNRDPA